MITKVGCRQDRSRRLPWIVRWYGDPDEDGNQRRYSKSFKHASGAKAFKAAKQHELDQGGPRDKVRPVTMAELVDEVFRTVAQPQSQSSQDAYKRYGKALVDHFGPQHPIRSIEQRHAETFMASRKRQGAKLAPLSRSTLATQLKYVRATFNAALDWGFILRNPFKPKSSRTGSPLRVQAKSRPWHHLSPDEFARMLEVVTMPERRAAYWMMYACGLRPGEASNLRADQIDLIARTVHVRNRAASKEWPPFTVKLDEVVSGSKERTVPIPAAAIADLTIAMQASFRAGGFVCLSRDRWQVVKHNWELCRTGQPRGQKQQLRQWQNCDMDNNLLRDTRGYLRRAGIEFSEPFDLKTLRKSFAQNHANAGTPPRTLADLMGHADVSVTMKFYANVSDANRREAARTSDAMFAKLSETRTGTDH